MESKEFLTALELVAKEKGMLDNENPSPYELSKSAYENINVAYKIIRQIGDDMYEVWKACIGEHDKVLSYGSDYLATKVSLSEMSAKLPVHFVQTHRSYIVNLEHVDSVLKDVCLLDDGSEIPISRNSVKKVNQAFMEFIKGGLM